MISTVIGIEEVELVDASWRKSTEPLSSLRRLLSKCLDLPKLRIPEKETANSSPSASSALPKPEAPARNSPFAKYRTSKVFVYTDRRNQTEPLHFFRVQPQAKMRPVKPYISYSQETILTPWTTAGYGGDGSPTSNSKAQARDENERFMFGGGHNRVEQEQAKPKLNPVNRRDRRAVLPKIRAEVRRLDAAPALNSTRLKQIGQALGSLGGVGGGNSKALPAVTSSLQRYIGGGGDGVMATLTSVTERSTDFAQRRARFLSSFSLLFSSFLSIHFFTCCTHF
jgi:hypothetical protein